MATLGHFELLEKLTKSLLIPIFLMYFLTRHKRIEAAVVGFLIFSFLGDLSSVFFDNELLIESSSIAYFLSYVCLVYVAITRIHKINFDKIIGAYLTVVFAINAYFMYVLFTVLQAQIADEVEVIAFGARSIALVVLAFVAFVVYLNFETKQSIMFLVTSLCFVFSDVLFYISNYYIYDWSFVLIDRVLHAVGLFFLIGCVVNESKMLNNQSVKSRLSIERTNNDPIAA
ncbi:hypothetical protein GCM10022271_25140 [Corallibacter vietnamensis]|uniref:YhhN-like protein n=2 Tax=Corallibacter vietnamensis TaxID=904130 RepID=A0ABP7HDH2_9FLAO